MFDVDEVLGAMGNGLGATDQAAGLRRWAEQQGGAAKDSASPSLGAPEPPSYLLDALCWMHDAEPAPSPSPSPSPATAVEPGPALPVCSAPPVTLMVVGLSDQGGREAECVRRALQRWHANGHAWVGDPQRWRVVVMDSDSPHLQTLAGQQARWALWVDRDLNSFRRAYLALRQLREHGGPQRLLVVHDGIPSHAGLLGNLRQAAANFLGIELLLLDERPRGML